MREEGARARRLCLWFCLNLAIFVASYLNYRLQLKHRYLYKTLNAGLCFSRAAAMVINFNLLLVWLPMCKYSLTWLAGQARRSLARLRERRLMRLATSGLSHLAPQEQQRQQQEQQVDSFSPMRLAKRLRWAGQEACGRLRRALLEAKINSLNSFLVAVDHCKSLHTICATTITVASAHLINVMNFSRNFDPLLSNLNMADYKGQNPLQLLISRSLMMLILIFMSLSSVDLIRNSFYDLFQIFHRLSVIFVLLLLLHPASHVIKEQSNVERHHPELCYGRIAPSYQQQHSLVKNLSSSIHLNGSLELVTLEQNQTTTLNNSKIRTQQTAANTKDDLTASCLDARPVFVAQSSICWYVLAAGLSCYLFDLILRKQRRSRRSIELLSARLDREQNLAELVLSNNHRRFSHWAPGQFVYLNCPQIAAYEWHPFTISSMDDERRHFTLHIKAGGDWTRKLSQRLLLEGHLTSPPTAHLSITKSAQRLPCDLLEWVRHDADDNNNRPQVECTKLVRYLGGSEARNCQEQMVEEQPREDLEAATTGAYVIGGQQKKDTSQRHMDLYIDGPFHSPFERLLEQQVSVCVANGVGWTAFSSVFQCIVSNWRRLDESSHWWSRWRHFAPTNKTTSTSYSNESLGAKEEAQRARPMTKLHLMVIVTSIEQLKPFYQLALNYFKQLQEECQSKHLTKLDQFEDNLNPIREITAFITRSTCADDTVKEFCREEKLQCASSPSHHHLLAANPQQQQQAIRVNDLFTIHFGKPRFEVFLGAMGAIYQDRPKISVYCCGSYQVKRDVRELCQSLNRLAARGRRREEQIGDKSQKKGPFFSYHEENF